MAVTGMGMDGLPVDKAGQWLYPFISWHCPRTAPQQAWWLEHIGADEQFARAETRSGPSIPRCGCCGCGSTSRRSSTRPDKWLLIEDFVNFMLCGEMATDYSMASTTLLFDQRTRAWNDALLQRLGDRPRLALRSAACRHADRPRARGRGRSHGTASGVRRLFWAGTTTAAAACRRALSSRACCWTCWGRGRWWCPPCASRC